MRLHDGLHISSFLDGSTEICAGMETMLSFPLLPEKQTKLLKYLVNGISRSDFFLRATGMGVSRDQAEQLLGHLQRAELISLRNSRKSSGPDESVWRRIGGDAMRQTYRQRARLKVSLNQRNHWSQMLAEQLSTAGIGTICDDSSRNHPDLSILLSWGFPNPVAIAKAMRHNQTHLPLVAGNDFVEIGPLVVPGYTPCASCVSNHRAAQVPDLQERAASLAGVDFPRIETCLAAMGAAFASTTALAFLDHRAIFAGQVTRIDVDGGVEVMTYDSHPDCGCLGIPPEIEIPPEPRFSQRNNSEQ